MRTPKPGSTWTRQTYVKASNARETLTQPLLLSSAVRISQPMEIRHLGDSVLYTNTSAGTVGLSVIPAAGGTPVPLQSSPNAKLLVGVF